VPPPAGARDEFWTVSRQGQCRLVLPLRRAAPGLRPGHGATSLGNYYTGLFAPAAHPQAGAEDWSALLRAVVRGGAPLDRLVLEPLPASALPPLRAGLAQAGLAWREEVAFGNWHEPVTGRFADYWTARPGALRSTAARARRRFEREGGTLEIVTGDDPASLQRALEAYAQVYAASWKPQEPYTGFIPALVTLAARRGWLRLGLAWRDGQALAAHLWLVHGGRAEIYKLAYREDAAAWSPGTLLGQHLMAHVIDVDRVREIDYLTGDDDYKRLWMGQRRERWRIDALNPRTLRGGLQTLARRLKA
jgi:CelD/BcsL family acetyltransferase involved in cellulose biosynthesis